MKKQNILEKKYLNNSSFQNSKLGKKLNEHDKGAFIIKEMYPYSKNKFLKSFLLVENYASLTLKQDLEQLVNENEIDGVFEDNGANPLFEPNDSFYTLDGDPKTSYNLWHLKKMEFPKAWDITKGDPSTKLAIIDTDFDIYHPDLKNKLAATTDLYLNRTFTGHLTDAIYPSHGTQCASFLAGHTNGGGDLASGGFNCSILPYFLDGGTGAAHHASFSQNVKVISISFRLYCNSLESRYDPTLYTTRKRDSIAIHEIIDNGTTIIASAGNGRTISMCCGGDILPFSRVLDDRVIIVSGTYPNDNFGEWQTLSNPNRVNEMNSCRLKVNLNDNYYWSASYYKNVDVSAPAHYLTFATSTYNNSYPYSYGGWGTSFTTPIVAGLVGLMKTANPCLTPVEIKAILKRTTDPIPDANLFPAGTTGTGRVNAYKAVKETVTRYVQNQNLASTIITRPFVDIGSDVTTTLSQGAVNVNSNSNVTINAREVIIKNDFTVPLGSEFTVNVNPNLALGCP